MTGLSNAQIAGKTLFLDVSERVFLEEMNISIGRLSKEDPPSPKGTGIIQSFEDPNRTKKAESGQICSLLIFSYSLTLDISTPGSQAFGLSMRLTPLASLVLRPLGLN